MIYTWRNVRIYSIRPLVYTQYTGNGRTDGQTGLVKQYRALHALHADAGDKN